MWIKRIAIALAAVTAIGFAGAAATTPAQADGNLYWERNHGRTWANGYHRDRRGDRVQRRQFRRHGDSRARRDHGRRRGNRVSSYHRQDRFGRGHRRDYYGRGHRRDYYGRGHRRHRYERRHGYHDHRSDHVYGGIFGRVIIRLGH